MKVICDAAVLIGLAKIDRLDLLRKLYGNIYIPWAVYQEVVVKGGKRPGVEETDRAKWIKKIKVKDRAAVNLLVSELGQGESEALILSPFKRQALRPSNMGFFCLRWIQFSIFRGERRKQNDLCNP